MNNQGSAGTASWQEDSYAGGSQRASIIEESFRDEQENGTSKPGDTLYNTTNNKTLTATEGGESSIQQEDRVDTANEDQPRFVEKKMYATSRLNDPEEEEERESSHPEETQGDRL